MWSILHSSKQSLASSKVRRTVVGGGTPAERARALPIGEDRRPHLFLLLARYSTLLSGPNSSGGSALDCFDGVSSGLSPKG